MQKSLDKKTLILVLLTALAVALTFVRERPVATRQAVEQHTEGLPMKEISSIVDSTFKRAGVAAGNIRHVKISAGDVKEVREETRVQVQPGFEVLRAITSLTDSLRRFGVTLVSTENLKDKTSSIHLLHDKRVFESIVISKEQQQKGAVPSVHRKRKGNKAAR